MAPLLVQASHLPLRARLSNARVTREALRLIEADVQALDGVDGETHLRRLGVAPEFIDWFWRSVCMTVLNVPLERVSAGALMRCYAQLVGHSGYCFGFPAASLDSLFVPATLRRLEQAGARVIREASLARLQWRDSQCTGGRLRDGTTIDARYTVCALPPREASALLDGPAAVARVAGFEPSSYVSLYLWFDRKVTSRRFWTRTWSPRTVNYDFYDLSNIRPAFHGRGSLIASNVIYAQRLPPMDDEALIDATLRELCEFAPGAQGLRPLHAQVHRIPLVVTAPSTGFESARPPAQVPGLAGVWIAGDWTRTALPESMESAVRSGRLAAEAVCRANGSPRSIALDPPATTGLAGFIRRRHERHAR
jgi:15-cis-phytoene desaturase